MNFFCTKKHLEEWVEAMEISKDEIFCLDVNTAIYASKEIFDVEL